jgi:hypothetical protein
MFIDIAHFEKAAFDVERKVRTHNVAGSAQGQRGHTFNAGRTLAADEVV